MAIENTYLLGKNITLGCGFDLQAKAPLDSRQTVPAYEGLRALIIGDAAYEGMIVYDEGTKKTYQAQKCETYSVEVDGKTKTYDIAFKEFGLTEAELKALIASETTAAMEFKGATTALPENPVKGDMWKVTATFEVAGETAKVGDSIVYNGEEWFRIPSGDDIEDTWRPITGVANDATLTFAAGDKLDVAVTSGGTVTYSHEAIDAPELLAENEQTRTYITEVETDGFGHITGYKTATENVVDTNTEYTFTSQVETSSVYFQVDDNKEGSDAQVVYIDAYSKNEADKKIGDAVKVVADDLAEYVEAHETDYDNDTIDSAVAAAKKAGEDAAAAVDGKLTAYSEAHASDYTNEQIDNAITTATGNLGSMSTKDASDYYTKTDIDDKDFASKTEAQGYATTAQSNAEAKAAELDATLKTELEGTINGVNAKFDDYVTAEAYNANKQATDKAIEDAVDTLSGVDAGFETRIAGLEAKFGEGEDTVESLIETAVAAETERATGIETGLRTDVNDALARVKAIEDAPYVTKAQLDDVDAKFAGYNTTDAQKAIDDAQDTRIKAIEDTYLVADDIKDFETKENVKKVSDELANVKATAEAAVTDAKLATALEPYAKTADVETKTDAANKLAEAKKYTDDKLTEANLDQYTTEQEVKDIVDDVIKTATDKETLDSLVELVEYIDTHSGDAINMATAIGTLEGKVETLEKAPAAGIGATDITNWNTEIGAKALAETKTTTAEVKGQIEAYGYATDVNAQKYATDAQAAAEGTAKNALDAYKLVVEEELAKKQNNIPENTYDAYGAAAQALQDAKDYADAKEHKDTTYTVAPTTKALEFTVTPSEGEAQTVQLVAPTVDTGVMSVSSAEGDDVVASTEDGAVTVAHKAYQTGTIKAVEGTEEPNFVTSVTINNGHVTGATVQTLRAALESMTFIFDGGSSTTVTE